MANQPTPPYRLLALDLDGTVLDSQGRIRAATVEALTRAAAAGVTVAVVTGRSVGSARHFAQRIGRAIGTPVPLGACNGAVVLDPRGERVAFRPIPPALLKSGVAGLRREGVLVSCYGQERVFVERPWRHLAAFWGPRRLRTDQWPRAVRATWEYVRTNKVTVVWNLGRWLEGSQEPVLKLFVTGGGEPERLTRAAALLESRFPTLHLTRSAGDNLEVTAPHTHKGHALRLLAESLRIPREAVMAIGDGPNDQEMLAYAGLGVAMGNAVPSLRAGADWVAPTCDKDGVAAAVHRWILSRS